MRKPILLFLLMIYAISAALANDGSYMYHHGYGGAVMPVQNDAISMIKETISIDLCFKTTRTFELQYDCRFVFKNTTNRKQVVLIGFPNSRSSWMSGAELYLQKIDSFNDFLFFVNDSRVEYKIFESAYNPEEKKIPLYDEVYVTEVTFLPNEVKTMRNTYTMGKFFRKTYDPMGGNAAASDNTIDYILMTGRTWKDPIGEADITVSVKNCPDDFIAMSGTPAGYVETKNRLAYHFTNFVPKEDIHLSFYFNKLPVPRAISQINDYFKRGDLDRMYVLFEKLYDTVPVYGMSHKDLDTIRTTAFFIAGKIYNINSKLSEQLYLLSFQYCYSNKNYFLGQSPGNDLQEIFKNNYGAWEHEGENNAPCYYIAYNLACIYSRNDNYETAKRWLQTAFEMKPSLLATAQTDPDLANYKKANKGVIENKRQKTMNLNPVLIDKKCRVELIDYMGIDRDNNIFIIYRPGAYSSILKYAIFNKGQWFVKNMEGISNNRSTTGRRHPGCMASRTRSVRPASKNFLFCFLGASFRNSYFSYDYEKDSF